MADPTDASSVATNTSNVSTVSSSFPRNLYKSIRRDIRSIKTSAKMIEFIFDNEEELNQLPTRLLNTWATIPDWTFKRRSGVLHFEPREKQSVKTLQEEVAELKTIIKNILKHLGLTPESVVNDV
jgi:hypothetical protein